MRKRGHHVSTISHGTQLPNQTNHKIAAPTISLRLFGGTKDVQ
jgi:hypothetical protein